MSQTNGASMDPRELLAEYLLGTLPQEETALVEAALGRDGALRLEAQELAEALGLIALSLPPMTPPPSLRDRLMTSLDAEESVGPLGRFADRLAAMFDVTLERARELLGALASPASWTGGLGEGIELFHVAGGPRVAGADAGFVRLRPGVRFPHHDHVGEETGLILSGGYLDSDGREYRAGDTATRGPGSDHDFTALPGEGCLFAVVVMGGVRFEGDLHI